MSILTADGALLTRGGKLLKSSGSGGGIYIPAPASAAVGQIVKIKAVDAAGKITETEAVDLPSGGQNWELINEIELTESANYVGFTKDSNGNNFALRRAYMVCLSIYDEDNPFTYVKLEVNNSSVTNNNETDKDRNQNKYIAGYVEMIPYASCLAWLSVSVRNYNWNRVVEAMGFKYNTASKSDAIRQIGFNPNDKSKSIGAAGTKVYLYGVRA